MKRNSIVILFSIPYFFISCGNDEKKQPKKEIVHPVNNLKSVSVSKKSTRNKTLDTIAIANDLKKNSNTSKKTAFSEKENISVISQANNSQSASEKNTLDVRKKANENLMTFVNLRKIFSLTKIGQTLTQDQLTQNFKIPEDAVKLVKSVTKTAENELAVKWHSTWFVEKVSDAELEDGRMKVIFKANKMYTSGKAIGIKYNKKIYNNLVIIGHSAYIPNVKGYSWQIGK
ncbi:hypothetical protein [Flavobacterium fluviatile]|uniref:hypothetical protein n=1 Tax=Flavobacterium fluviatile TaxID=1862387 RepID=UPI0013D22CA9|nr:hypothetical protein [Flavobacterium fluviatile]